MKVKINSENFKTNTISKKTLKLKTMKTMKTMKTNYLKVGALGLMMLAGTAINAQQTSGDAGKIEDVSKSSVLNGTIRVIDNKGTKKFLQVKNGLTLLTDTATDGGIISTWQLGGTLSDDTYIDVNGKVFGLDGIDLVTDIATASTNAVDKEIHGNVGSGFTVLIRDEATGALQKIKISDLLQVQSGQLFAPATVDGTAPALTDVNIPADYSKVYVYRNGAKLVATVDYTVATGAVTLVPSSTSPNDWAIYKGDVFEVHWVK